MPIAFRASGSVAAGTGAITPALPSGVQTDDLILLLVETANQAVTLTGTDAGNWTQLTSSPQGTGTAAGTAATRLTVYYRWVDGTEAAVGIADSGDHQIARTIAYSGVDTTSPFNAQAGNTQTTATTAVTFPSVTTTVDDCMILLMEAHSLPDSNSTTIISGHSNANLANIQEQIDNNTNAGNGGGISLTEGEKATAGSTGTTSATLTTSAVQGKITLALTPLVLAPITGDLAATETGNDTFSSTGDVIVQGSLAVSETGDDTFAASGTVSDPPVTGTLAVTETGNDTLASTGTVLVEGSLAATETGTDTFASTGDVFVQGSLDATEGADDFTADGQGTQVITGSLAATETGADSLSATGDVLVIGTFSASEASDTFAGAGVIIVKGNLTASEAGLDTFEAVQGAVTRQGDLAATEASDFFGGYVNGYVDGYVGGVSGYLGRIGGMAAVESGGAVPFGINAVMKFYDGSTWQILYKDPTIYN